MLDALQVLLLLLLPCVFEYVHHHVLEEVVVASPQSLLLFVPGLLQQGVQPVGLDQVLEEQQKVILQVVYVEVGDHTRDEDIGADPVQPFLLLLVLDGDDAVAGVLAEGAVEGLVRVLLQLYVAFQVDGVEAGVDVGVGHIVLGVDRAADGVVLVDRADVDHLVPVLFPLVAQDADLLLLVYFAF